MLLRTLFSPELLSLGVRSLRAHKLRSFLTALGMIFGVGAVICMLSIGEGASAEQLASIRQQGSQNIILRSVQPPRSIQASESNQNVAEYGIKRRDVTRLAELPGVIDIVQMREVASRSSVGPWKFDGRVVGVTSNLLDVVTLTLQRGRFLAPIDEQRAAQVAVIGTDVATTLFPHSDPIGRSITVYARGTGTVAFEVIGILGDVVAGDPAKGKGDRNINQEVYIPLSTAEMRYGETQEDARSGSRERKRVQISDLYLKMESEEAVLAGARNVQRVMEYGHPRKDYQIEVPLELLITVEKTKRIWQAVLGSIAGISLLVGGIGIMNIMLASVTERTREIGIRRALGAKRYHITAQFLVETLILSIAGGLIGILFGISFALAVPQFTEFQTIIPWWGVALSFGVSALVGIGFGLYPARAAARLDPIEALRFE